MKPVILALAYYECPMLCPMVLDGLLKSLRVISLDLEKDFEVVTVSFDPEETPELKKFFDKQATLPSGTRLGPYEIRSRIGAGGMGQVYRARSSEDSIGTPSFTDSR